MVTAFAELRTIHNPVPHSILVGGAITILKNDGVRQWEGLSHILIYINQGSDKGGGVVQMVLVDTERNAQGAQLQNASACTFFQLQNEEHNSFWLGK